MPYTVNDDLPPSVRDHLPDHAQDIFRACTSRKAVNGFPAAFQDNKIPENAR
jgi:cation transport regulator ChaB